MCWKVSWKFTSLLLLSSWRVSQYCFKINSYCLNIEHRVPGYRSRGPGSILEGGTLSLMSTTEELHGRKSSGSDLESRKYGLRDPLRWPHGIPYQQKLALTSLTCSGHSVGIVRSRTKDTKLVS
jgi:hypothetical protein